MTRISLNVIVYNEEARLEECLTDARDHVDEIVVVDQMSTDGTPEIAQRLADVYVRDVHHGHAEPSRELAAERSSGDWILILDADEKLSEPLKAELRDLVARDADGYWINKVNFVGGIETGTIEHFRLVRKSRTRFDPSPHGGATPVSDNVEHYERIGIVHEKSVDEQIFDDVRYERMAFEDDAPPSAKRSWLAHNQTLREVREQTRRFDLEALVPAGAVDRVVVELTGDDLVTATLELASTVAPGGVIVGTVPAARNQRRLEDVVAAFVSDAPRPDSQSPVGSTRAELIAALLSAGLDVRWTGLVHDGWLDPVALRPDASGTVVESSDFLLRSVAADVAEELTANEIVFVAARPTGTETATCSIVLVARHPGSNPDSFAAALRATTPRDDYELIIVQSSTSELWPDAKPVPVADDAGLAARWNAGARAATGELLVFVSTDVVPSPGWLDAAVDAHRSRPDIGAVGSKVVARDDTIEHAGLVLGEGHVPYRIYQGDPVAAPQVNRPRIMPAIAAEGMVTTRARFVEVGGFDESLGEDLADADFCLRLRARGLPILYSPAAVLHAETHSLSGTRGVVRRSAREFAGRWSRTAIRSDEVVCAADACDINAQTNRSWRLPRPAGPRDGDLPAIAWTSHFLEQGGYTEEAIAAIEALDAAGLHVVANAVTWERTGPPLPADKAARLTTFLERDLPDDFVHVNHLGAHRFKRHPEAMRNIGRTMFETDGLPAEWRDLCNTMDEIWVPSAHNLATFARAGVATSKLHRVPETFDTELFDPTVEPLAIKGVDGFVFLSMFSWISRKAWDVLLRAWFAEFDRHDDVTLVLKTDTDLAPPGTNCEHEVEAFARDRLHRNPKKGPRIVVLDQPLESADVPRLYRAADAFVLASHGEGWGRPYMEAMAMELPTIATRWSGNLEFMNDENSYLVGYKIVDCPPDHLRLGQRWAQPSVGELRRAMRRVYEDRSEAAAIGKRARADVLVSCAPELVAAAVRERIEAFDRHPVHVPIANGPLGDQSAGSSAHPRPVKAHLHLTACVVVGDNAPSRSQCLASLRDVADTITVVDAGASDDMAAVRNQALDRAAEGWVLMLDATHTLDPESVDLVRALVNEDQFVGYAARELHQFGLDGAVSAIEQRTPALFPVHPELRYVGRVAEQLLPRRPDLQFRLASSRIVLHQHDARSDRRDPVATARRDLPLLERSAREEPDEPFHLYNLGAALDRLGLHGEAETALRNALELAPRRALWEAPAYAALSHAVAAQGRTAEAVKLGKAATKSAPDWARGWCLLGALQIDAGRIDAGRRAYRRALDCIDDSWLVASDLDDTAWQARAGLARLHLGRGEYREAFECFYGAVALNPTSAGLRVELAHLYEAFGRSVDNRDQLERAIGAGRVGPEAHLAFADFFTKRAEEALLRGLADNAESRALLERIESLRASSPST